MQSEGEDIFFMIRRSRSQIGGANVEAALKGSIKEHSYTFLFVWDYSHINPSFLHLKHIHLHVQPMHGFLVINYPLINIY